MILIFKKIKVHFCGKRSQFYENKILFLNINKSNFFLRLKTNKQKKFIN